uniref:Uncharacterized protein n=1 Tax=Setaria viridis TaxID=4556 RepID=A0A4U6VTN1_SETVI|nr:hypothetical protein SEVIR_2G222533v2 [Setaria viridis]
MAHRRGAPLERFITAGWPKHMGAAGIKSDDDGGQELKATQRLVGRSDAAGGVDKTVQRVADPDVAGSMR